MPTKTAGARAMALTPELVAKVHRDIADEGPMPGLTPLGDDDYAAMVRGLLGGWEPGDDLWIFAYGSLIWKPACPVDGQEHALLRGWQRRFCMRLPRFRGTRERPGLMMSIDRGGVCQGVTQRISRKSVPERLEQLIRREMSVKPSSHRPIWVTLETERGHRRAVAFASNPSGPNYVSHHSSEEVAQILASACGHWGSCAEYLMQTVHHLEELGIHDGYLWELQERVAEIIRTGIGQNRNGNRQ